MIENGVIHGRFQVLHQDHLVYLMAARDRCRHLIVGITNPDPSLTGEDSTDRERSLPEANPLTYFERQVMVRRVLVEAGWGLETFSVVPFPINFPRLYAYYVPMDATFFLTVYDDWGRRKRARFEELGLRVQVLWERTPKEKGIRGTEVRARMVRGEAWEHLVPPATASLMKAWNIPGRLQGLR